MIDGGRWLAWRRCTLRTCTVGLLSFTVLLPSPHTHTLWTPTQVYSTHAHSFHRWAAPLRRDNTLDAAALFKLLRKAREVAAVSGWAALVADDDDDDEEDTKHAVAGVRLLSPVRLPSATSRFVAVTSTVLSELASSKSYSSACVALVCAFNALLRLSLSLCVCE